MEIKELILLLNTPEHLHVVISEMRLRKDLTEEERGFLILYDHYNGDPDRIQTYLKKTKEQILKKKKGSGRMISFYRMAAVFIVVLGTGIFFLLNRTETSTFSDNHTASSEIFQEPGIPIYMGQENSIDWAPLMYAYERDTPQQALKEWKKIEKLAPQNDTLIYFGGIVHQRNNKLAKATSLFEKNANSSSVFADRSAYFLLQIAKANGDGVDVKKWLERLKNTRDLDLKPFVLREHRSLR
jgi:hypothetical protein